MIVTPNRKTDAIISLCQHDDLKSLLIEAANQTAEKLLGYEEGELDGIALCDLLPSSTALMVQDFLNTPESERNGELTQLMGRIKNFSLTHKNGDSVAVDMKLFCGETSDENLRFEMLLHSAEIKRALEASHDMAKRLDNGTMIDEESGLPNREAFSKDLELVRFHVGHEESYASVAFMVIDNYKEIASSGDRDTVQKTVQEIGRRCKRCLRGDDMIARIAPDKFGVILMDADRKSATIALNRLRWSVGGTPVEITTSRTIQPTVSIGFSEIAETATEEGMFRLCDAALADAMKKGGNHIQAAAV